MLNPTEPSSEEQAEWPEATEHYVRDLEQMVEQLRAALRRIADEGPMQRYGAVTTSRLQQWAVEVRVEAAKAAERTRDET